MDVTKVNAEVLGVLMALGIEYMNKLPSSVMDYLTKNSKAEDVPNIDASKPINEQPISKDAKAFLLTLKLQYFCNSKSEKESLINELLKNENE